MSLGTNWHSVFYDNNLKLGPDVIYPVSITLEWVLNPRNLQFSIVLGRENIPYFIEIKTF
jgi:hypothetical protein